MREGIGGKQITEFIIPARGGNAKHGNQGDAKGYHQQPDHNNGQDPSPRQPQKAVFHILKAGGPPPAAAGIARTKKNYRQGGDNQGQLDDLNQ